MKYAFWIGVSVMVLALSLLQSTQNPFKEIQELEEKYTDYEQAGPAIKGTPIVVLDAKKTTPIPYIDDKKTATESGGVAIKVPIMIYHSVRPYYKGESAQQDRYDITPELFEQELKEIERRNYTTITFAQLRDYFLKKTPLPERPIILSFDDGWRNQYEYAFPLLQKYHMTGTFFVFSGAIGSRHAFMNWDELLHMQKAGMEIQSHTHTHPVLTKEKPKRVAWELTKSKQELERKLGTPMYALAYPFGMFNEEVVNQTHAAGYTIARTTHDSVWHSSKRILTVGGTLSTDNLKDFIALLERQ